MNVETGTETPIFLFWEYLFRNFGILSLQCVLKTLHFKRLSKCKKKFMLLIAINFRLIPIKFETLRVPSEPLTPILHEIQRAGENDYLLPANIGAEITTCSSALFHPTMLSAWTLNTYH
jgi:hypothetical protein